MKDIGLLDHVQRMTMKLVKGLESKSHEEQLRKWGVSARKEDTRDTTVSVQQLEVTPFFSPSRTSLPSRTASQSLSTRLPNSQSLLSLRYQFC